MARRRKIASAMLVKSGCNSEGVMHQCELVAPLLLLLLLCVASCIVDGAFDVSHLSRK